MTTPKTQAQIDRLVEDGKIAIVAYGIGSNENALLVERYDKEGRAHRETIEIKPTRSARPAAQPEQLQEDAPTEDDPWTPTEQEQQYANERAILIDAEEHDAARQAALATRPITRLETKAANRLAHANARLAEAQAHAAQMQAEHDAARQDAENAWLALHAIKA